MHAAVVNAAPENEATIRLMLLRDLERGLAEQAPEHVELLAAIRELVSEAEAGRDGLRTPPKRPLR